MSHPGDERTFITYDHPFDFPRWITLQRFGGTEKPLWRWECTHHSHRWGRKGAWYDTHEGAKAAGRRHIARNHHST